MAGKRSPHHTQFQFWVTREASEAINAAARKKKTTRAEYLQDVIWDAIEDLWQPDDREWLLPRPIWQNRRYVNYANHKPGYKGRWAMWVQARANVHNRVPLMLTKQATKLGHGSASAYVRHCLAIALKRDTGKTVPMPAGRTSAHLFGGKINEEVR